MNREEAGEACIIDTTGDGDDLRDRSEPQIEGLYGVRPAIGTREEDRDLGVIEAVGEGRAIGVEGRDERQQEGERESERVHPDGEGRKAIEMGDKSEEEGVEADLYIVVVSTRASTWAIQSTRTLVGIHQCIPAYLRAHSSPSYCADRPRELQGPVEMDIQAPMGAQRRGIVWVGGADRMLDVAWAIRGVPTATSKATPAAALVCQYGSKYSPASPRRVLRL